jgi:hypothetical protein
MAAATTPAATPTPTTPAADPAEALRRSLGIQTPNEISRGTYARILVLGVGKVGKTTSLLTTAPKPLIIDGDTDGSVNAALRLGAEFMRLPCHTVVEWKRGVDNAVKAAAAGLCESIIVDPLSLISDTIVAELSATKDGRDLFREVLALLVNGVRKLTRAKAHVFIVSHFMPPRVDESKNLVDSGGILPGIPGQAAMKIPALMSDWVVFEATPSKTPGEQPTRQFLVGPQKLWAASGRNANRSCAVPANVPALFAELGIALHPGAEVAP